MITAAFTLRLFAGLAVLTGTQAEPDPSGTAQVQGPERDGLVAPETRLSDGAYALPERGDAGSYLAPATEGGAEIDMLPEAETGDQAERLLDALPESWSGQVKPPPDLRDEDTSGAN